MNIKPSVIHSSAVHPSFNTPQNKLCLSFKVVSDFAVRAASFYEHNGVYWFCLECDRSVNSVGFVSLRNCASAFMFTVKSLGFAFEDEESLKDFVLRWEHSLKSKFLQKRVS